MDPGYRLLSIPFPCPSLPHPLFCFHASVWDRGKGSGRETQSSFGGVWLTRMWMVEPRLMCRQHLLGEHGELHQVVGHVEAGNIAVVRGLARKGYVDTSRIRERHDALAAEMEHRGYRHESPLEYRDAMDLGRVDVEESRRELRNRCPRCAARMEREVVGSGAGS